MIQKRKWSVEADGYIMYLRNTDKKMWANYEELAEQVRKVFPEYQSKTAGAVRSRIQKYESGILKLPEDRTEINKEIQRRLNEL